MATGKYREGVVRWRVVGEGSMAVFYEVGVETPEDKFQEVFACYRHGDISNLHADTLKTLYLDSTDDTWHLEVTEGPGPEIQDTGISDPQILDTSDLQVEVTGARGEISRNEWSGVQQQRFDRLRGESGECSVCAGEGQGAFGDREFKCPACSGTGQESAVLSSTDPPGEKPGW